MEIFEKIHTKVKFKSFGKANTAKKKDVKKDEPKEDKGQENEEEKAKELLKKQIEDADKEIEEIRRKQKGTVGTIYEVAKRVRGGKKVAIQPLAIQNPKTGRLVISRTQIKSVTLKYCQETLSNNPPESGFGRHAEVQKELQSLRMEATDGNFMVNKALFNKVLNKFKLSS